MPRWHNYYLDGHAHFCTAALADRRPILVDRVDDLLYREWNVARAVLGVRILAYVVMPEHFHVMLWSESGLSIRSFLQQTLSLSARSVETAGRFWKERPRVLPIYSEGVFRIKVDYIHSNPVRRRLVATADAWLHSSFRQLHLGETEVAFACDAWDGMFS